MHDPIKVPLSLSLKKGGCGVAHTRVRVSMGCGLIVIPMAVQILHLVNRGLIGRYP
jgi:hypothetical protein